jgi:hypothetical protein
VWLPSRSLTPRTCINNVQSSWSFARGCFSVLFSLFLLLLSSLLDLSRTSFVFCCLVRSLHCIFSYSPYFTALASYYAFVLVFFFFFAWFFLVFALSAFTFLSVVSSYHRSVPFINCKSLPSFPLNVFFFPVKQM